MPATKGCKDGVRRGWLSTKLHRHDICRSDMCLDRKRYGIDKLTRRQPTQPCPPKI